MDLKTLLNAVQSRTHSYGIGTAAPFLRQFERCLGGTCPAKYFESVTESRWRRAVKAARRQLVYHHPEMSVAGKFETAASRAELPPHTIALFPAVITTTRQDREGDILETRGAELDPKAPLLYQHMPFENIGRLIKQGKRTSKLLTGEFSLCGTPLGEDCAMLAEHGALRISHGFTADEFEPLDEKEYEIPGFRVLKFKILEVSLVSIPSNPDAEITAFSRNKLVHPLTKAVASVKYSERPVMSPVMSDVGALHSEQPAGSSVGKAAEKASVDRCDQSCPCHGRCKSSSVAEDAEMISKSPSTGRSMNRRAVDVCEGVQAKAGRVFSDVNLKKLRAAAGNFLAVADDDEAHEEVANLARQGHAAVKSLLEAGGDACQDADECREPGGNPLEPDLAADQCGKAGRAVSRENAATIRNAMGCARAICDHEFAQPHQKTLANRASCKLSAVLGQTDAAAQVEAADTGLQGSVDSMSGEAAGKNANDICDALVRQAAIEHALTGNLGALKALAEALSRACQKTSDTISRIERQSQWEAGDALITDAVASI